VARYSKDGLKIATCIFEAALWRYSVRVSCRCRNTAYFEPTSLWWRFHQKRWEDAFWAAKERFVCLRCMHKTGAKVRPIGMEQSATAATITLPGFPDEREWKRMVNRFRG
jgi:hypothetical protein